MYKEIFKILYKLMKPINYDNIKFEQTYVSGISFDKYSLRKYKYKITESEEPKLKDKEFYSEAHTKSQIWLLWNW